MSNLGRIWIFGDEYGAKESDLETYHDVLLKLLGVPIFNFAKEFTSQEYCFHTVVENIRSFSDNDLLIIFLTDIRREWFFSAFPDKSDLQTILRAFGSKKKDFYENFFQRYQPIHIKQDRQKLFINYIKLLTKDYYHCPLIIKSFPNSSEMEFLSSIGDMEAISRGEFKNQNYFLNTQKRPNNLSQSNHQLFGNKIVSYLEGKSFSLTKGFVKNLYQSKDELK